ncbi:unnamed protein product [Moneuplotes crassus]|uniref:Uncharacterized protein n=1 Tax=Euplotes crassus TaxID=5936 RepID=A0AAD1UFD8_EUPCR|nr:unnamed protein product [Moneuplotes crassus]
MGCGKSSADDSIVREKSGVGFSKRNIRKEYQFLKLLGEGAFGEVRLAMHVNSSSPEYEAKRAIKLIKRDNVENSDKQEEMLLNEYNILRQIDNQNIIKIFELWKDEVFYYIVTEYLEGGELYKNISERDNFTEKDCAGLIKQVLLALNYCHKEGIAHRDLKPDNIMFESNSKDSICKLVDFGFASFCKNGKKMDDMLGTPLFIAPEIISNKKYTSKVDIWSLGVITYFIISTNPPFKGRTKRELFDSIKSGDFSFKSAPIFRRTSESLQSFISECLVVNPEKRATAEELLKHSWMTDVSSEEVSEDAIKSNLATLKEYSHHNKLQQGIVHFLAYKCGQREEIDNLSKIFRSADKNGDGKLDKSEISEYFQKYMGSADDAENEHIYSCLDGDKSGYIDYSEFLSATIDKENLLRKQRLINIFNEIDSDGSGDINLKELRQAFKTKASKKTEEEWEKIINEIDKDGNDCINFKEFLKAMDQVVHPKNFIPKNDIEED